MTKAKNKKKTTAKKRIQGFNVVEDACIWMKAGVVNFRICDNNFDCSTCPFDKGMRKAMGIHNGEETEIVSTPPVRDNGLVFLALAFPTILSQFFFIFSKRIFDSIPISLIVVPITFSNDTGFAFLFLYNMKLHVIH